MVDFPWFINNGKLKYMFLDNKQEKNMNIGRYVFIGIYTCVILFFGTWVFRNIRMAGNYAFNLDSFSRHDFKIENGSVILDSDSENLNSPRFCLRKGEYTISFIYEADVDYQATIYLDNDLMTGVNLPAVQEISESSFYLAWPTDRAYISFGPPDGGTVVIKSISIKSDRMLYTDGIFQLIALTMIYALMVYLIINYKKYSHEKQISLAGIILMAVIVNIPLYINIDIDMSSSSAFYSPFAAVTRFGTDTSAQLMRLQGVMYGFLDRQFPVMIAPNFLLENGEMQFMYPNIFLYPFALMRLMGASMPMVFRWFSVICNVATILAMYYSCRQISDNTTLNLAITALYVFEPHRLRVVLTKGAAMGMGIPYIFIPLAIVGLYLIIDKNKKGIWLLAFGVTGVLESHITSVLLLMILLIIGGIFCFKELITERIQGLERIFIAAIVCALMNLGFLVIFIYYYSLGLNTDSLKWTTLSKNTLSPVQMLTDVESLFYAVALIIAIILLALSKIKGAGFRFPLAMTILSGALWLMTCNLMPYDSMAEASFLIRAFLDYMQKPHRFYTVMAGAVLISILILVKNMSYKRMRILLGIMLALMIFTTGVEYLKYMHVGWLFEDAVTGDINSVVTGDYLPDGTDAEMEFSGVAYLSDEENVESMYYKKQGTTIDYHYRTGSEGIYADFPLMAYEGYAAVDEAGNALETFKGEDGRLSVYLNGDGNDHAMHIEFVIRPVFRLLYIFSLLFSLASVCYYIVRYERKVS